MKFAPALAVCQVLRVRGVAHTCGRIALAAVLLGAAVAASLSAEPAEGRARIINGSGRKWVLRCNSETFVAGLRVDRGDGRGPVRVPPSGKLELPQAGSVELVCPQVEWLSLSLPLAPGEEAVNPYRYRVVLRVTAGRLSLGTVALKPPPAGYVPPFTRTGRELTIHRSSWAMGPEGALPATPPSAVQEATPAVPALAAPSEAPPDPQPARRGTKRRDHPTSAEPPAQRLRPDPEDKGAMPAAGPTAFAPGAPGVRTVTIANTSGGNWLLEFEQPFDPAHPVYWRQQAPHRCKPVRPLAHHLPESRSFARCYLLPPHSERCVTVAAGGPPVALRPWSLEQNENPQGFTVVCTDVVGSVPVCALDEALKRPGGSLDLFYHTVGLAPDRVVLHGTGWAPALLRGESKEVVPGPPAHPAATAP